MSALTVSPSPALPRQYLPPQYLPPQYLPPLRITARGRAVLTVLVAAPLVIAALIAGLSSGDARASLEGSSASFEYLTVAPGQSLWSIAERLAPTADPREVVADIVALNQLASGDVQPGQRIAIPTEYAD